MVRRLKAINNLLSNVYLWIVVFILLCFFSVAWYINESMKGEATEQVETLTKNVARSNIHVIINMLNDYEKALPFIYLALKDDSSDLGFNQNVRQVIASDSSINKIFLEQVKHITRHDKNKVKREVCQENGEYYFRFSLPINDTQNLCMLVSLLNFHKRVAENQILGFAYTTITYQGIYLYHPDENMLGKSIEPTNVQYAELALQHPKDTIIKTPSDYLNLLVYSYFSVEQVDGQKWLFAAHYPDLEISDSFQKTANYLMIISLLAILSFLLVFGLGIYRWRKDTVRRQEIEQENMRLLLRDEQNKQTLISTELERLKSGLNPHFLFNSLSSLHVLINKKSDVAKYFTITLSNLYRYMLRQENHNVVTLKEELEFTENYINLQKIRFANKIVADIQLSDDVMDNKVLPISLQLLVENCIKHTKITEEEPLRIKIYTEGQFIVVVNNHNPRQQDDNHSGKGIENIIRRYSILTQAKCKFEVQDGYYFARIPFISNAEKYI